MHDFHQICRVVGSVRYTGHRNNTPPQTHNTLITLGFWKEKKVWIKLIKKEFSKRIYLNKLYSIILLLLIKLKELWRAMKGKTHTYWIGVDFIVRENKQNQQNYPKLYCIFISRVSIDIQIPSYQSECNLHSPNQTM